MSRVECVGFVTLWECQGQRERRKQYDVALWQVARLFYYFYALFFSVHLLSIPFFVGSPDCQVPW